MTPKTTGEKTRLEDLDLAIRIAEKLSATPVSPFSLVRPLPWWLSLKEEIDRLKGGDSPKPEGGFGLERILEKYIGKIWFYPQAIGKDELRAALREAIDYGGDYQIRQLDELLFGCGSTRCSGKTFALYQKISKEHIEDLRKRFGWDTSFPPKENAGKKKADWDNPQVGGAYMLLSQTHESKPSLWQRLTAFRKGWRKEKA